MNTRTKLIVAASAVALAAVAGTTAAVASSVADDSGGPITGSALSRASAAALEHTGGGRVTGTEVGDEESFYEVEVTLDDGSAVDVQLDRRFAVVGSERDGAGDDETGQGD